MRITKSKLRKIIKEEVSKEKKAMDLAYQLISLINEKENIPLLINHIFSFRGPDDQMSVDEKRKLLEDFNLHLHKFVGR